jgi:hypothetical protein
MDIVEVSRSDRVLDGLRDMMTAAVGPHELVHRHVEVPTALLLIEAAKRAEDRDDWFPHGKWATVQAMQERVERELRKLFAPK